MKLALLFALVAAAAVLSHSAPTMLDAAVNNADAAQVDDVQVPDADESILTDLISEVEAEPTKDVQINVPKKEDIGTRHEEIHKNGIIDLIDAVRPLLSTLTFACFFPPFNT
jgi:hypothetical protein